VTGKRDLRREPDGGEVLPELGKKRRSELGNKRRLELGKKRSCQS